MLGLANFLIYSRRHLYFISKALQFTKYYRYHSEIAEYKSIFSVNVFFFKKKVFIHYVL